MNALPRTKKNPNSIPQNGLLAAPTEVLTLAETATYLRIAKDDIIFLVREQRLPGRHIGQNWRFHKLALQDWLSTSPPIRGLLQFAGANRDDPHAEEMLMEVYRQRGRAATEEG